MARVRLEIRDLPNRLALKALLEADGHEVFAGPGDAQVVLTDQPEVAEGFARDLASVLLANAAQVPRAVQAMRRGVFGYVFAPLVPGEAPLIVERALAFSRGITAPRPLEDDDDIVPLTLEEVEEVHILDTMRRCRDNQARAARELGIGRNTLWRKLKRIQSKLARPEK